MTVQIQKAQAYALLVYGLVVEDRDMYLEMWPNRSWITARQNFVNLKTGRTKSTKPEWLIIIADKTKAPISLIIGEQKVKSVNLEDVKNG